MENAALLAMTSLVTVICICYNHEKYVRQALDSVVDQDYPNVELIIVDDGSKDNSVTQIQSFLKDHPRAKFIKNKANLGNCVTFNNAFRESKGDFIIDLAADDILDRNRLSNGVHQLESRKEECGVHYCDAWIIDDEGQVFGKHSELTPSVRKFKKMPEGDVFKHILSTYFICPPTTMFRRKVINQLKGYDENLSYEDFDFLVRSSREYKFCYSPETLVSRRLTPNSKSSRQHSGFDEDLISTFKVCEKALHLVNSDEERKSFSLRLGYECRQAVRFGKKAIVGKYIDLMARSGFGIQSLLYRLVSIFVR